MKDLDKELIKKYLDTRKELKEDFIKNIDNNFFTFNILNI